MFFTTSQQLLNDDTNESSDLYRYELPSASNPNPSPNLIDVTNSGPNAQVQQVLRISEDGTTVYFIAKGVLASNHDCPRRTATRWRRKPVRLAPGREPSGRPDDVHRKADRRSNDRHSERRARSPRTVATSSSRPYSPLTPTDTDNAADIYRYDLPPVN